MMLKFGLIFVWFIYTENFGPFLFLWSVRAPFSPVGVVIEEAYAL